MAFPVSELVRIEEVRDLYGADLPTYGDLDAPVVRTLLGHRDDMCPDGLRAGLSPSTVTARPLTDGRYAVAGYWSLALKAAWESGNVQAEELSEADLQALTPEPDL